jgi:hypothetical protein
MGWKQGDQGESIPAQVRRVQTRVVGRKHKHRNRELCTDDKLNKLKWGPKGEFKMLPML